MQTKLALGLLAALMLTLGGCGKKSEAPPTASTPAPAATAAPAGVTVSAITLGNALGANKKVTSPADSFGTKDTIYASVDTSGAGTAALKAKWTYLKGGKEALVKEDTQTIAPSGPATSEFHVSKPDGWPTGDYRVEVFVADNPAGTKNFTVR